MNKNTASPRRVRGLVVRYLLLLIMLFITVGPLVWQFTSSIKGPEEPLFGTESTLLPQSPTFRAYSTVFDQVPMALYIRNSLIMCILTVASQIVFPTLAGFMLSRKYWRGRKAYYALLIVSMMFPFESIMVSLYMQIQGMGLSNSFIGVWLPGAIGAVNVLLMRAAFAAVPDAIEEAAMLDGAGELRRFWTIYLPAARGTLVVVIINSFIAAWDDFLWPFIVLRSEDLYTLSLGLSRLASSSFGFDPRVVMAGSIIAIVPVLALFIVLQRYFFKGVEAGAVK